ncbi:MAG: co-chaperone DjlA [Steroidobacteraceae bacterium]|nr:co-chaperone DjlA [Steroidobacteraceae bacterium]MDW8258871.1 co-chaperone DjlA [Gammaproteobacteria bacterium]
MKWLGKLLGGALGLAISRSPVGALIGVLIGHLFDERLADRGRVRDDPQIAAAAREAHDVQAVAERFFRTTFEVMGHVAKSDGRVSEAEIDAARAVMQAFRLNEAQTDAAIAAFNRGKSPDYDFETAVLALRKACAGRPDLLHAFLEIQLRAALQGSDLRGPPRERLRRLATLFGVDGLELARLESVLRLRFGRADRATAAQEVPDLLTAAYSVLEVAPSATNEEVERAYRRQLSRHHPDKLKANGLPESMLEYAKQRTQQVIEAWERIKRERGIE